MVVSQLTHQFNEPLYYFSEDNAYPLDHSNGTLHKNIQHSHVFTKTTQSLPNEKQTIGLLFSGGPAPGGHDVITGILTHLNDTNELIGFKDGPVGLLNGNYIEINKSHLDSLSGLGGFDFLGTGRKKISSNEQIQQAKKTLLNLNITCLIIIGGDDSNTNALFLANALYGTCNIIGIPKTIDGDLLFPPFLQMTFGFHSACQHYTSLVQSLSIDAAATKKYWHTIKLMGRSASHITLDVALKTTPNACILSEEIIEKGWDAMDLIRYFSDIIENRFKKGNAHGTLLFPEGILEAVPEFKTYLSGDTSAITTLFNAIGVEPTFLNKVEEDSYGNKNFSLIPTEYLLIELIKGYLEQENYASQSIKMIPHFFGYTGRSIPPSPFDSIYSKLLGKTAYELACSNITGCIAGCQFKNQTVEPVGIPLHALIKKTDTDQQLVISKSLVNIKSHLYSLYKQQKDSWINKPIEIPRQLTSDTPLILDIIYEGESNHD